MSGWYYDLLLVGYAQFIVIVLTVLIYYIRSYLLPFQVACVAVESHQLDSLVVGAGGQEIARWAPRKTVDTSFVVFRSLEKNCRGRGIVVVSVVAKKKQL